MDKQRAQHAIACAENGFSCAQTVLSAFSEDLGLDKHTALKVSGAFGGGMAGMADTCGAVTGAFMVIGLKYGKTTPGDDEAKARTYALARTFAEQFKAKHGSLICRELVGCDISTPEGKQTYDDRKLGEALCRGFVKDAIEILEAIL